MIHLINYTGNIGCGKTTRLNEVIESYGLHDHAESLEKESNQLFILDDKILGFVFEPVDNNPFLLNFYMDKKRYGFLMEIFIIEYFNIRLSQLLDQYKLLNTEKDLYIYTDYGMPIVFINHLKSKDLLDDIRHRYLVDIYQLLNFEFIINNFDKIKIKYIDTSPEECLNNINKRNRGCEVEVSLELLNELDSMYKKSNNMLDAYIKKDKKNFKKIKFSEVEYIKESQ